MKYILRQNFSVSNILFHFWASPSWFLVPWDFTSEALWSDKWKSSKIVFFKYSVRFAPQNLLLGVLRPAKHESIKFLGMYTWLLPVDLEFGSMGVSRLQEHGYSHKNSNDILLRFNMSIFLVIVNLSPGLRKNNHMTLSWGYARRFS